MILTGLIQLYSHTGRPVQVSSSNDVALSADVRGATTFYLVSCLAWNIISQVLRPSCFSLMDANRTDWYVSHYYTYLRVHPEYDTGHLPYFKQEASFILHPDTFYPGHYALESQNLAEWYFKSHSDGRLAIVPRDNVVDYYDTASFRIYDYNTSSTYSLFTRPRLQLAGGYCFGATHVGLSVVLKFRHTKWSDLLQVKIKMFLSVHLSNRCILIKFKVKHQGQVHENSEIVFDGNSTSDYPIRVTAINLAVAKAALFYSPVDSPMHQTCIRVMHV